MNSRPTGRPARDLLPIDRYLRNQLLENQFVDLPFLAPMQPLTPRTDRTTFAGIDRMIRGTFQCWATANDLIGYSEIEGCGVGGGATPIHDSPSHFAQIPLTPQPPTCGGSRRTLDYEPVSCEWPQVSSDRFLGFAFLMELS